MMNVDLARDTSVSDVPDDEPISVMSERPSIPPLPADPTEEDDGSITLDSRSSIYNTQLSAENEDGEEENLTSDSSEDVVQFA